VEFYQVERTGSNKAWERSCTIPTIISLKHQLRQLRGDAVMRDFNMMGTDLLKQTRFNKRGWGELIPVAQQTAKDEVRKGKRHDHIWICRPTAPPEERRRGKLKRELFFLL